MLWLQLFGSLCLGWIIKAIKMFYGIFRVYLWGGQLTHVRAWVAMAWVDCCAKLKHGGLSLTVPEVVTRILLVKCVV